MSPIPDDYIDVAERIRQFKAEYPDGSLQSYQDPKFQVLEETREVEGGKGTIKVTRVYVMYSAAAYRTPDDPRPGIGWAWEPVPGPTPFTKDSELMNAETSAWGRAIVALGFETKKIASAEEVRNRQPVEPLGPPDAPPAAPFPQSIPETVGNDKPKPETLALVKDVLARLNEMRPDIDWVEVARTVAQTKFNKQDSQLLNDAEMFQLAHHMEKKLEQKDPGVPA